MNIEQVTPILKAQRNFFTSGESRDLGSRREALKKLKTMIIHQLSVFLENKSGRLTEVLEVLGEENMYYSYESTQLFNYTASGKFGLFNKYIGNLVNLNSGGIGKEFDISASIRKHTGNIKNEVIKIKLEEIIKNINPISNKERVNDNHLVNLMQYYDLVNELKTS
jgi:hypothetical protein